MKILEVYVKLKIIKIVIIIFHIFSLHMYFWVGDQESCVLVGVPSVQFHPAAGWPEEESRVMSLELQSMKY